MKKEELERNTEKFLCYCSKVTYKKFEKNYFLILIQTKRTSVRT